VDVALRAFLRKVALFYAGRVFSVSPLPETRGAFINESASRVFRRTQKRMTVSKLRYDALTGFIPRFFSVSVAKPAYIRTRV